MAACVRLAMALLPIDPRGADFVWWFDAAHRSRTATTLKVVSVDLELQHYSTKVASELLFFSVREVLKIK
jgi:hypothetical protein